MAQFICGYTCRRQVELYDSLLTRTIREYLEMSISLSIKHYASILFTSNLLTYLYTPVIILDLTKLLTLFYRGQLS